MSKESEDKTPKRVTMKILHSELKETQRQSEIQNRMLTHKLTVLIDEIDRLNIKLAATRSKKKASLSTRFSAFSLKYNLRLLVSAAMCFSMAAFGIFWLLNSM